MKILKVENCSSCPYLRWSWKSDACVKKNNKKIKDIKVIPKWCPLEDYKLKHGEKFEAIYNEIWEHFEFSPSKELLHMNYEDFVNLITKLKQKYFPKGGGQ